MKKYKSIERIPIWNFNKILETKEVKYLAITDDYEDLKETEDMWEAWNKIFNEYLEKFGITEDFKYMLLEQKKIAIMRCDMAIKGDYGMKAAIEVEESRAKEKEKNKKGLSFEEMVSILEEERKMAIDIFKTSAAMFYTYWRMLKKKSKQKAK